MSSNENIIPAALEPGESIISQEQAEKFQDFINDTLSEKDAEEITNLEDNNVITNVKQRSSSVDNSVAGITAVANGVIGTGKVARKPKAAPAKPEVKVEKVAVYSSKNVTWNEVGKVYKGYNLVTPEQAEKWLTRSHIRSATPEEVAKEFGY